MKDIFIEFLIKHKIFDKYSDRLDTIDLIYSEDIDTFLDNVKPVDYIYGAFPWTTPKDVRFWDTIDHKWQKEIEKHDRTIEADNMSEVL